MALAFEHESRVRELIQLFSRERDPEKVEGVGRSASAAFEAGRHAAQGLGTSSKGPHAHNAFTIRCCALIRSRLKCCCFSRVAALLAIVLVPKMDEQLLLQVQKAQRMTQWIVGAPRGTGYVGLLTNKDKSAALIEIIPMKGRGNGNGKFCACYLERWNGTSKQWDYVEPRLMSSLNPIQMLRQRDLISRLPWEFSQQRWKS